MNKIILHRIIKYSIVKIYLGTFTDLIYICFAKGGSNMGYRQLSKQNSLNTYNIWFVNNTDWRLFFQNSFSKTMRTYNSKLNFY